MNEIGVIIAAAGESKRMGRDKLLIKIGRDSVLARAVRPFLDVDGICEIVVAAKEDKFEIYRESLLESGLGLKKIKFAKGGDSRAESVFSALSSLSKSINFVLVHDGARPYVSASLIKRVIEGAEERGVAVPAVAAKDAILLSGAPFNRELIRLVQTPQGFNLIKLVAAYEIAKEKNALIRAFDDYSVWVQAFGEDASAIIAGCPENIKITGREDLPAIYGSGYDIHRFTDGDHIFLGGVKIPSARGVSAHSDGDILIHAVIDALLSAAGLPDIGVHFPDTDEKYRGVSSMELLSAVLPLIKERGLAPLHLSANIIAESPKIAPFVLEIKTSLASALGLPLSSVGITATTNEKVGDIGNNEAIACIATVTLSII
ncbi:MAG TPA: 2-C-methyl-D-erythritol 2,4-cyclodiphosphate synthase [Eubacteriales bacterium]|nr:2-C-methyl-D-erythritol 2,4-cyclodiphosphate synthase [Eubacteriales bacterium]